MTPIEAALARVRELRETERKMTEGPWAREATIIHGKDYGCTGVETKSEDGYELCRGSFTNTIAQIPHGLRVDGQPSENMVGIAALRNAAAPMLALLEALLIERNAQFAYGSGDLDLQRFNAAFAQVEAALAAFVEET